MLVKDGVDMTSIEGAATLALRDSQLDGRSALAANRRSRPMVAIRGLVAQRLCDRSVHR